jgi:hypothetical protein
VAVSYPEKIAFSPWSYNGAKREGRRRGEGKIFPIIGKADLFYLLYRIGMLLSVAPRDK